jgi:cell wall-associated NlpC family hydrolase
MLFGRKPVAVGLALCLWGGLVSSALAQKAGASATVHRVVNREYAADTLTRDDGQAIVATALDRYARMSRSRDCSHLVHAIYDRAGFPYAYASSTDLYRGTDDFQRVKHPQPGDLVVWRGHVGIVVNPAHRVFYSFLRHGPGIDAYDAQYWKRRGPVRFYRYIKGGPAGDAANSQ